LESTAPAALKAGLSDPDFAQTLRAALLAAARTSDATKRSVLARAISERLEAGAESPEAAIATMAVAAVPTLGRRHLEILGTLAVLHAVRPEGLPLPQSPPEGVEAHDTSDDERRCIDGYVGWLQESLRPRLSPAHIGETDLVHLTAASCVVIERKARRSLVRLLDPTHRRRLSYPASRGVETQLGHFFQTSDVGRAVSRAWDDGLQHVTPTSAGLLIGIGVHEAVHGGCVALALRDVDRLSSSYEVDDSPWDGKRLNPDFVRVLGATIEDAVERGEGPWRGMFRRRQGSRLRGDTRRENAPKEVTLTADGSAIGSESADTPKSENRHPQGFPTR
jgi:hypothetical protein